MGTRGYKAWRFRKRYYYQYNHYDSYPRGLGKELAGEIPPSSQKYSAWLEDQRRMVAEWEARWDEYLAVDPSSHNPLKLPDNLDFMTEQPPSWMVPLNDIWIEWVYILDLDREIFSVNNGAHFKLDRIPHVDWIAALADGGLGDKIALPGLVREDAIANLVADPRSTCGGATTHLEALTIAQSRGPIHRLVKPRDLVHIPWRRRHGPLLRSHLYFFWLSGLKESLAATLLQWSPQDLPFREIAFAMLCLALGGKYLTVISTANLDANSTFGFWDPGSESSNGLEFVSVLATGAHVRGATPGTSPEGVTYWLENVLVVLATQLYRSGAVKEEISRVVKYCHDNNPNECVDAVLMSIEHAVLIHVIPNEEVQHSALLPLIDIPNHLSMNATERYASWYLDKFACKDKRFLKKEKKRLRNAADERMRKQGLFIHRNDSDEEKEESSEDEDFALYNSQAEAEGCEFSAFYALSHVFDAAARRRMPPAKAKDGHFPNEIYANILGHVTDMETRNSCMEVSRVFRQICQEDLLFADHMVFAPCEACKECVEPDDIPKMFDVHDVALGEKYEVGLTRVSEYFADFERGSPWGVLIGDQLHKKSLPQGLKFRFRKEYQ
ncbi:MAG: hypothetical protein Q9191_004387 [Dirinaria sp. TL-2023a]